MKVLSLGWGVQSWTLAAMVAKGELEPIDYAIHADTTWERSDTYAFAQQWTPWLIENGVNVVTVKADNTNPIRYYESEQLGKYQGPAIPAFTVSPTGTHGKMARQCTQDWKVSPIRKFLQSKRDGQQVEQWLGISLDEMGRAGESKVKYITHRYPLLEKFMTRSDCAAWLQSHGLPLPPKSACVFCPFHNRTAWEEQKRAGGQDWEVSVRVDNSLRHVRPPFDLFVHRSGKPLADAVVIPEEFGYAQTTLWLEPTDDKECNSGHCFL